MENLARPVDRDNVTLGIDPTEYADPLFGVGSATPAGPTLPAGSIHPSPETLEKKCGGYRKNQPIVGFGQAYTSGAGGVKCFGNYLLAPMVDGIELNSENRASFAINGSETAKCYEYKVELENNIKAKVTPAHNAAIYSFEYPAGKEASFLIDVARKLDIEACMKEGYVTVDPANKSIYGGGLYSGNINKIDWEMFFALEFDSDFSEIGTFKEEELTVAAASEVTTVSINDLQRLGAYVKFGNDTKNGASVKVKIAISFVSVEKAKAFLNEQIPSFDYDTVRENAKSLWKKQLSVIELNSSDPAMLRRFYTAIYCMNIQPRDRTSDHGTWDDYHTIWDSWKTVFPMYSLIYPQKMGAIIDSFIDRAKKNEKENNGIVISDQYISAKEYLAGQGGNDVDNTIADAYLKGVELKKHTWEDAYNVLLASAEKMRSPEYVEKGYATNNAYTVTGLPYSWRFKPASATLGFAFNDKAVAAVARELGSEEEYQKYEKRSANWLNCWNPDVECDGFFGFPQIKNDDGTFTEGYNACSGYNTHYYEMTGWDGSYINYNDVPRLVETMGGAEMFTKRLVWASDHSAYSEKQRNKNKEGYFNYTNEPSFQIPWLFCTDEIKRPDIAAEVTQKTVDSFFAQDHYPGDEDNGAMSSYFIFLMSGFFPYATTENYYLHGTRIEDVVFHLGNGKDLHITGENVGAQNIYVQSATWQGKPLNECKLTHKQILEGGELHFVMGDKPSAWAKR